MPSPDIRITLDEYQKFILCFVKGKDGSEIPFLWSSPMTWHKDIADEIEAAGNSIKRVAGGGRVKVVTDEKLSISGARALTMAPFQPRL